MKDKLDTKLQESYRQNPFKISYYSYSKQDANDLYNLLKPQVDELKLNIKLVVSGPDSQGRLFIDFLPINGSKADVLDFIASEVGATKQTIFFSGNSGNDRDVLISGVKAVYVGSLRAGFANF